MAGMASQGAITNPEALAGLEDLGVERFGRTPEAEAEANRQANVARAMTNRPVSAAAPTPVTGFEPGMQRDPYGPVPTAPPGPPVTGFEPGLQRDPYGLPAPAPQGPTPQELAEQLGLRQAPQAAPARQVPGRYGTPRQLPSANAAIGPEGYGVPAPAPVAQEFNRPPVRTQEELQELQRQITDRLIAGEEFNRPPVRTAQELLDLKQRYPTKEFNKPPVRTPQELQELQPPIETAVPEVPEPPQQVVEVPEVPQPPIEEPLAIVPKVKEWPPNKVRPAYKKGVPYLNPTYTFGVKGRPKGTKRSAQAPAWVGTVGTAILGQIGLPLAGSIHSGFKALGRKAARGELGGKIVDGQRVEPGGAYVEGEDHSHMHVGAQRDPYISVRGGRRGEMARREDERRSKLAAQLDNNTPIGDDFTISFLPDGTPVFTPKNQIPA